MNQPDFNELLRTIPDKRDSFGKLQVPFFIDLGRAYKSQNGSYNSDAFKSLILGSGVLKDVDFEPDGEHQETWRHRVDRATQRINTGI